MITLQAESLVPTDFGNFRVMAFLIAKKTGCPHIALVAENTDFLNLSMFVFTQNVLLEKFSILKM